MTNSNIVTRINPMDGLQNVAVIQILSGLACISLQVFVFVYYHDGNIEGNNTLFTLAVGSFGLLAGILGCLKYRFTHQHTWIGFVYLGTSIGVVGTSILYFASGYWDFYTALKEANNNELNYDNKAVPDEAHFWLQAGLFLCVVTLALFSLAGTALLVTLSRCGRRTMNNRDLKRLIVEEQQQPK